MRHLIWIKSIIFIVVLTVSFSCTVQDNNEQKATGLLQNYYKVSKVPGVVAAVGVKGKIAWSGAAGYAILAHCRNFYINRAFLNLCKAKQPKTL